MSLSPVKTGLQYGSEDSPLPQPNAQTAGSFCISLNFTDRLRLIGCPPALIDAMRIAIQGNWGTIQKENDYYGSHQFKLQGNPWHAYGEGEEAIRSRRLILGVLTCAISNGWNLLQGADVSRQDGDKDALFFENGIPDPDVQLFAMSFNLSDRMRLINAPPSFVVPLRNAVLAAWSHGIQDEREYHHGSYEIKLVGNPWVMSSFGAQSVLKNLLLCQVIANFRSLGFKLYASLNLGGNTKGGDLESWVFRKVNSVYQ